MKVEYDNKFFIIATLIFIPIIVFFTILHHLFPEVLHVPDVLGPYFIEPIWLDLIIQDIIVGIVALIAIQHGFKTQGKYKTTCFLYGAIIFAGLVECFGILSSRFNLIQLETYFFTKGGLWFLEIPLYVCLAWFFLAWSFNYVSEVIFPNRNYIFHAFIAGIMAVSLDLWIDPVIVNSGVASIYSNSEGMYVWLTDPKGTISIFSIPLYNFLIWFFVVFFFLIIYSYILNDEKIENNGKTKSALIFFGLIPVCAVITTIIIYLPTLLLNPFLSGISILPIILI